MPWLPWARRQKASVTGQTPIDTTTPHHATHHTPFQYTTACYSPHSLLLTPHHASHNVISPTSSPPPLLCLAFPRTGGRPSIVSGPSVPPQPGLRTHTPPPPPPLSPLRWQRCAETLWRPCGRPTHLRRHLPWQGVEVGVEVEERQLPRWSKWTAGGVCRLRG